jgi:hypothetical protein
MSGYIELASDRGWQAASGLFRFVAGFVADRVGSATVTGEIRDMVEFNLPHRLSLDELPVEARRTVLALLRDGFVAYAETALPRSSPDRDELLAHIRELADLAREVTDRLSSTRDNG